MPTSEETSWLLSSPGSVFATPIWRKRRREGQGHLWFLSIGRGGFKIPDRVWLATPERGSQGKKARSIKLLNMAVDRLKERGAKRVFAYCTHPILSGPAVERIANSQLDEVVIITWTHDAAAQARSYELLAQEFSLTTST